MLNLGQILLLISLVLSGFSALGFFRNGTLSNKQITYLTNFNFLSVSLAFIFLTSRYIISDFSYINVFENSNSLKPLIYKITGVWGNHEGSMLLFLFLLNIYSFLFCNFSKYKNKEQVLTIQNLISFLLCLYIYFVSDPFIQFADETPIEGAGLNPLLQDIGLASHPPILYLGYSGFSLAFSLAIIAAKNQEEGVEWALTSRFWSLISFSFLTIGVALGSWWAYRELGWGGFWFWDSVENSSLLPWLVGLALIHCLLSTKKFGFSKNLALCLSVFSFIMSIFGFFIVRSGILSSVHSFASDPTRGIFMLSIMVIITIFGFYNIIFKNLRSDEPTIELGIISRYGLILGNILLLAVLAFTLILAILYPVIMEFISNDKISIGQPYFNAVYIPISLLMALIMVYTPYIKWPREKLWPPIKKSINSLLFSIIITAIVKFKYPDEVTIRPMIGLFFGLWILSSLLFLLIIRKLKGEKISQGFFAMCVSHIGFGLLLVAISLKVSFELEKHLIFKPNDKIQFAGYNIGFKGYSIGKRDNYFFQSADFLLVNKKNDKRVVLTPENRVYMPKLTKTHESAIYHRLFSDVYLVLGESIAQKKGYKFPVRIFYKPFTSYIWIAAFIIALGAFIGILPNRKKPQ